MACGECWESVIRADERQHLHEVSATQGQCAVCGDTCAFETPDRGDSLTRAGV
jgi:hypothetical protein